MNPRCSKADADMVQNARVRFRKEYNNCVAERGGAK